jgi:hypothetical protein
MSVRRNLVASGGDLPTGPIDSSQVRASLERLEMQLGAEGYGWRDVDLLWLANSKELQAASFEELVDQQTASDTAIVEELRSFASARRWFPPLLGSTVRGSFYATGDAKDSDVSSGLMWIAFCAVSATVPVGVEISDSAEARAAAGSRALQAALDHGSIEHRTPVTDLAQTSIGFVVTSGSGHVDADVKTEIDFKECYAVGQELKRVADDLGIMLTGGCASNRSTGQSQALYFSAEGAGYNYTYGHAAVVAILPRSRALLHLEHPYKKVSDECLSIDFHPHEMFEAGRYFCVSRIDGQSPSDYLRENGWQFTDEEFALMVEKHTAIPTEPRAHYVTIASASPEIEAALWPNVPVWFERVDGEVILRLVRAEAQDSDFYLVRMSIDDLVDNAGGLAESFKRNRSSSSNLLAFLCESRKYVLAEKNRNDEAETLLSAADGDSSVVGIYLNGEYSTGDFRSIGYHNYSQIGVLLVDKHIPSTTTAPSS